VRWEPVLPLRYGRRVDRRGQCAHSRRATLGFGLARAITPSSSGPCFWRLAKARYHLLTNKSLSGTEAERIGLVAAAVPDAQVLESAFDAARTLAAGSPTAIRWTKHALNNWLRLAGPSFDTSLALEFLGFKLADVREGLAAARGKRRPVFDRDPPG